MPRRRRQPPPYHDIGLDPILKRGDLVQGGSACGRGRNWNVRTGGQVPGPCLVSKQLERFGIGTDKDDVRSGASAGEVSVFSQKSIAGMDGVALGAEGGGDYPFYVQIGPGPIPLG